MLVKPRSIGLSCVYKKVENDPLEPLNIIEETRKAFVAQNVVDVTMNLPQLGLNQLAVAVACCKCKEKACDLKNTTYIR